MDLHRTTAESMLQLHRAGLDLAERALSRSDRLIAATPSFDEEREASGAHIAASIERARAAAERDDADLEPTDAVEQDEPHCHICSGTGEGQYGRGRCWACRGSGVPIDRAAEEERAIARADHQRDVEKDARAERGGA